MEKGGGEKSEYCGKVQEGKEETRNKEQQFRGRRKQKISKNKFGAKYYKSICIRADLCEYVHLKNN